MNKDLNEHFRGMAAIRKKYREAFHERIREIESHVQSLETKAALAMCEYLLLDIENLNDDMLYQAEKLIEKQEEQNNAQKTTNSIIIDMLTTFAKKVNAFELVKQDVDKLKDEQTKQEQMREGIEQHINKRTEEIRQKTKQQEQDIKRPLPGIG